MNIYHDNPALAAYGTDDITAMAIEKIAGDGPGSDLWDEIWNDVSEAVEKKLAELVVKFRKTGELTDSDLDENLNYQACWGASSARIDPTTGEYVENFG